MALPALSWSLVLGADAATEGKKVIGAMLIVGLVFVGVIALGETMEWLGHRRRARARRRATTLRR
jgi:hypothetical protein